MNITFREAHVVLDLRGSIHLHDAAGVRISCKCGVVWVTQHLDTRDILVRPGETFEIERRGVTVVHAMEPSHIALSEAGRRTGNLAAGDGAHRALAFLMKLMIRIRPGDHRVSGSAHAR